MRSKVRRKLTTIDDIKDGITLFPGRRQCNCEASRHELVSNCLNCGRIVCEQEGIGNCFTCGQMVMTRQQRQSMRQMEEEGKLALKAIVTDQLLSSDKSKKKSNSGLKDIAATLEINKSLAKAIGHKDQMLEFDRNSFVRTKVIDDQNDYFSLSTQNWISNDKRKELSTKVKTLHENKYKKQNKILIDFNERTATDYKDPVVKDFNQQIEKLYDESQLQSDYVTVDASHFIDKDNTQLPLLQYVYNNRKTNDSNDNKKIIANLNNMRLQDIELMSISDEGMCLSVNQPYASLLVYGIKRFEGRNWYSNFRGRLWIRSNNKTPDNESVKEIENFYCFAGIKKFPNSYPTSAILGCVTVSDCLPLEDYKVKFPDGDTEDNFILVCEDHKQMSEPVIDINGGGLRIYKLNQKIHLLSQKKLKL
ncbi:activating signal cointegrator 1-like [Oppia nitens]|uniref:activating signal cointegrator 1-like n=1 Tax=Oppia nitens TaxID=1686743 RepID=UPI0023DB370F|nr:activating signal cointegrator 1-like [Oppia nitens]